MKKILVYGLCAVLTLSSCSSTGEGAYMGSQIGAILGSAIGGISSGWRGSDIGTVVGMAGGAVAGAAIGSAGEKARQKEYEQRVSRAEERLQRARANRQAAERTQQNGYDTIDDSGFDPTHSGDDRIVFESDENTMANTGMVAEVPEIRADDLYRKPLQPAAELSVDQLREMHRNGQRIGQRPAIEVRRVTFTDSDGDGRIGPGEDCKVSFEIMNNTREVIHNLRPFVTDTTANKRIKISQGIQVESIAPGTGIRYTATVSGSRKLKDGTVVLRVGVEHDGSRVSAEDEILTVKTHRR